ncbi:MAG: hypothetical protein KatS3mg068_1430 [Candidatus Sericytochromatia bacterium]|nr:MAG: hypothetical protein KatS3mg068_1430 [Candidatus Sericytochromatia bacterium]
MTKKTNANLCIFYVCKDYSEDLLLSIKHLLSLDIKVLVFNIFEEIFPIENVIIINTTLENLKNEIIFQKNKIKANFLLILDDTETIFIDKNFLSTENLKNPFFNINIYPDKDKVFDYEIEVFKSKELRLFNLKNKISDEFFNNFNLIDYSIETLPKEYIHILKKDYKTDIELLKIQENNNLFKGIYHFYNNSIEAEKYLYQDNSNISKLILIKLNIIKNNLELAKKIAYENSYLLKEISTFYFYLAEISFRDKKYSEVITLINKGFKLNKLVEPYIISDNKWKPYLLLGKSLFYLGRYLNSKKFLEKANSLIENRKSPEILFYLIKVLIQLNDYKTAFDTIQEILKINKLNKFLLNEVKYLFLNLLLYIDINDNVIEILKTDLFNDEYSILRIADTLYMNEDYQKALQIYLFVKDKFNNNNKDLLFKIAYVCAKSRLLKESAQFFEKFLEYEPQNLDVLNNLAFIYLNLEYLDKSEYICKKILEINSFSFEAYFYLSLIYLIKEDKLKSKFYIDKAKMINPVSPEIIKLFQIFKNTFNE